VPFTAGPPGRSLDEEGASTSIDEEGPEEHNLD
jgi:hypothetical protein